MDGKKVRQFSNKLQGLNISSDIKDINILLLGETDVGKSTFVNAITNYSIHKTWNNAAASDHIDVLIPYEFTVKDKEERHHRITSHNCEYLKSDVKSYILSLPAGKNVRFIDTPNIDNNINLENILSYISQLSILHAICYVLRPEEIPNPVYLEQILSRLDQSVGKNLIFVLTNTRETRYKPGKSLKVFKDLEYIFVDENKNVFCFDNEPFRYLAAVKQNVEFEDSVRKYNIDSWNKSNDSWWSLIKYVANLSPLLLKSTISINEVQRFILQLSQPLLDIVQYINDQLFVLESHEHYLLFLNNDNFDDLKTNLHIPFIDLDIQKLTKPVTVCAALKCCSVYKLGNLTKRQHGSPCHDSCYLRNVPKNLIGSTELLSCDEIDSKSCKQCGCDYSTHKQIYYVCTTVQLKADVPANIKTEKEALEKAGELATEIIKIKREMEDERYKIVSVLARCAYFLRENALTPFNDIYKDYMNFLIRRGAPISIDSYYDAKNLQQLNNLLKTYEELLDALKEGSIVHEKLRKDGKYLSHLDIHKDVTNLFSLKHVGKKVKELYHSQKTARKKMLEKTELIHSSCFGKEKTESLQKQINEKSKINKTHNEESKIIENDNEKNKINKNDNDNSKQSKKNENNRKEKRSKSRTRSKSQVRQRVDGRQQKKKLELDRPLPPPYSPIDPKVCNSGPSSSFVPPNSTHRAGHYPSQSNFGNFAGGSPGYFPPGPPGYFPPGPPGYFPPGPPGYFPPGPPNNFLIPRPRGPFQGYTYNPYAPPDPRVPPNPYPQHPNSNNGKNEQECEITVIYKPKSNSPAVPPPYQPQHPMYPPHQSQFPPPLMSVNTHPRKANQQKYRPNTSKPPQKSQTNRKSTPKKNTKNTKKSEETHSD